MARKAVIVNKYEFFPVTPERWDDFEQLFGQNGGCAGCWCMWFRMKNKEFNETHKEVRKETMRTVVQSGFEPGILAYGDGNPIGWVALAPREWYQRLATSKLLGPVDQQPVWVISCFFIHRDYRRNGLMEKLLQAAIDYARTKNVRTLEAFPMDVEEKVSSVSLFTGKASVFEAKGFKQVALREYRPILRLEL